MADNADSHRLKVLRAREIRGLGQGLPLNTLDKIPTTAAEMEAFRRAHEARAATMPPPRENPDAWWENFQRKDPDAHMRRPKKWSLYEKLAMRLNAHEGEKIGGVDHLNIFEGPNYVFVFIVHGEKGIILEDDVALFPSDGFIGRFRLATQS